MYRQVPASQGSIAWSTIARVWRAQAFAAVIAALLITLCGCSYNQPSTTTVVGTVSKVHDGDSIHITPAGDKRVIIRLAGIDAPELAQAFGLESRDKLRSLILRRKAAARCHKTDRYKRQVCVVYQDNADVNLQMISSGLAWHYKQYESEQTRKQRNAYSRAEREAQRNAVGLWSADHIAPWEFRQAN